MKGKQFYPNSWNITKIAHWHWQKRSIQQTYSLRISYNLPFRTVRNTVCFDFCLLFFSRVRVDREVYEEIVKKREEECERERKMNKKILWPPTWRNNFRIAQHDNDHSVRRKELGRKRMGWNTTDSSVWWWIHTLKNNNCENKKNYCEIWS